MAKPYVRLTQPLVRETPGGELRPATWDEALDRTVAGFQAAMAAHGPLGQGGLQARDRPIERLVPRRGTELAASRVTDERLGQANVRLRQGR